MTFADLDPLQHWLHPDHDWHKLDGPYYPSAPVEQIPILISKWAQNIARQDDNDVLERMVIADKASDELLGVVTRYWISEETNWAALGIVIYDPDDWGKGYGYEGLGLWTQYQFDNTEFVRLGLRTWSGNIGMTKLSEKLGYVEEARFRMARIVQGKYYDGMGYGVLRDDWTQLYPDGFEQHLSERV